mgnify:CR=1 FL=1
MMHLSNPPRVALHDSIVLVIDIQDKLLAKIPTASELITNASFLLDVANELKVPVEATEQYPKGVGPTNAEIAKRLKSNLPAKTSFSCCGAAEIFEELTRQGRPNVILIGMETHVCVMQSALDLLGQSFRPWLVVDALAARYSIDHDIALRRLEKAGAVLTTVEAVAFEWLGDSTHPQFKTVSQLIQQRMKGKA